MSNKISGFTVAFENSVSEDYMQMVKQAIGIYKGVIAIEPVVEGAEVFMGGMQESNRIKRILIEMIQSDFGNSKLVKS